MMSDCLGINGHIKTKLLLYSKINGIITISLTCVLLPCSGCPHMFNFAYLQRNNLGISNCVAGKASELTSDSHLGIDWESFGLSEQKACQGLFSPLGTGNELRESEL